MNRGIFITFEGTEGGGKSTQIQLLADRIRASNRAVRLLREPGGTAISEEIRHLVKHHPKNAAMKPETELLLICAARAQLVREVIHPALAAGEIVLCDRFYDSTTAYQGYGRQLDLAQVRQVIDFAIAGAVPDLTLLLHVPLDISESRRQARPVDQGRDRMEEAGRSFFERVEKGFLDIAALELRRVKLVDATRSLEAVAAEVWKLVEPLLPR